MSIATLKRKSQAQYNNNSVGQIAFSLNGTRRNQGYVGQTSLSRSLPRTLARGKIPRGHGGIKENVASYYSNLLTSFNIISQTVESINLPMTGDIITDQIVQFDFDNVNQILQSASEPQITPMVTPQITPFIGSNNNLNNYIGSYFNTPQIFTAGIDSLNDPTVVKGSVINTKGMLEQKSRCITNVDKLYYISCGPTYKNNKNPASGYNIVKPDTDKHSYRASDYTTSKAQKTINNSNLACNKHINKPYSKCTNPQLFKCRSYFNYTKPKSSYLPTTQSDYVTKKTSTCPTSKKFYLQVKRAPFGCGSRN
jgi:hypothetical protein